MLPRAQFWTKTLSCLCGLGLGVVPVACRAQAAGVVVTELRTPQPAVQGRFATVRCTIKNTGMQPIPLKAVTVALVGEADQTTDFKGAPPNPPLAGGLRPGQSYMFRQFQQMPAAGDAACLVRAEDARGQWRRLTFSDGRPARATLHVVPLDAIPHVLFQTTDPHPTHVYRPGQTISLRVVPVLTGGPDLSPQVTSVQISTPAKPFAMSDPATARDLLHGGTFAADFWAAPDTQKFLDLTVAFAKPVEITSWRLSGENLNGQYGLQDCVASVVTPDGSARPVPVVRTLDGSHWTALSALPAGVTATGLRLRLSTAYKINITGLALQGGEAPTGTQAGRAVVTVQWQDAWGKRLSQPVPLTLFRPNVIPSPGRLALGYVGLVLTTHIPGVDPTRRELGFAVLPPPDGRHDARLGLVHPDIGDPNLDEAWIKTLATNDFDEAKFTLDGPGWQAAIADRRAHGLTELPLMADSDWASDSTVPVAAGKLQRIHDKMVQYFRATPDVHFWELGLEENLGYRGHRQDWVDYWPNLEAKARAVRQAATDAHAAITLIYQIAERDPQTVEEFCRSRAQRQFDVLALHPYLWPDFPPPEQWMPPYLAQARAAMAKYGAQKPIWFTEIGAPLDGNPGGFFGYPANQYFVQGLSRSGHAAYLVKCHLMALRLGVAKVFWYTNRDGGNNPEYAEDFFGMIDFWGYPKPSYLAYCTMARVLTGKPFGSAQVIGQDIQVSRFADAREECAVVWAYPAATRTVPLASLHIAPSRVIRVLDLLGRPVPIQGGRLPVTGDPVYVLARP